MILNPIACVVSNLTNFDTYISPVNANLLVAYLQSLGNGTILLGMTGDEPTNNLTPALSTLQSYGVSVADVPYRGKFTFILQKGSPGKTVIDKEISGARYISQINVRIKGNITS